MRYKNLAKIATFLSSMTVAALGAGFDTGFLTYTQPNDTTFQARYWGDEFEWHMETDAGYAIICNPTDNYYYYAVLNSNGDYAYSQLKVGIDSPTGIPLHLDRSITKKAEIMEQVEQFMEDCDDNLARHQAMMEEVDETVVNHCAVVLVYTDDRHYAIKETTNTQKYEYVNFQYLLDSDNFVYNDVNPDGDAVFCSVRDYYHEVSWCAEEDTFQQDIRFTILNDVVADTIVWVYVPGIFMGPDSIRTWSGCTSFFNAAAASAIASPYNLSFTGYDDICFIVGGYIPSGSACVSGIMSNIQLGGYLYPTYWQNEQWIGFAAGNSPTFSHIGGHCHEYGHVLGLSFWWDIYSVGGNCSGRQYMLMSTGNNPGPLVKGECPSHMGVWEKCLLGWINPSEHITEITSNMIGVEIGYSATNPQYFRFTCPNNEVFFMENRRHEDFNSWLTGYWSSAAFAQNMLLVDRCRNLLGKHETFMLADGASNWYGDWGDPFPGYSNIDSLTALSPKCTIQVSYWSCTRDYHWNQTGLALYNIESDIDDEVIRLDIYHNYWAGLLNDTATYETTDWSGTDIIVGGPGVYVDDTNTLEIAPGSVVSFKDGMGLEVEAGAVLTAIGTEEEPITFQGLDQADWAGIAIYGQAQFEHCIFLNCFNPIGAYEADLTIDSCTFYYCEEPVFMYACDSSAVSNSYFGYNSGLALEAYDCDFLEIVNNVFEYNDSYGVKLDNCAHALLQGNSINNNDDKGLILDNCSPVLL